MFGALTAFIPLITQVLPALTGLISTPAAGNIMIKAADAAEKIFGTRDPGQIQLMIEQDKTSLERYKAELLAATEMERQWYADVQSARSMEVEAMRAGSKVQWAPVVITALIFIIFFLAFYLTVAERISASNVAAQQMVGALIAAFTGAWGYWLGSSKGSDDKSQTIRAIATSMQGAAEKAADVAVGVAAKAAEVVKSGGMFK